MRILKSHPLLKLVNSYVIDSPQPSNISYLWNFGVRRVRALFRGVSPNSIAYSSMTSSLCKLREFTWYISNKYITWVAELKCLIKSRLPWIIDKVSRSNYVEVNEPDTQRCDLFSKCILSRIRRYILSIAYHNNQSMICWRKAQHQPSIGAKPSEQATKVTRTLNGNNSRPRDLIASGFTSMRRRSFHSSSSVRAKENSINALDNKVTSSSKKNKAGETKTIKSVKPTLATIVAEKLSSYQTHDGKYNRIMQLVTDPLFLVACYEEIKGKPGNMTKGIKRETLDGLSFEWFEKTALKIKQGNFNFLPSRRIEIPKPNSDKFRPLTIASPRDKIVQKALQVILEAIWENTFLDSSHGFRPKRSVHTALAQIYCGSQNFIWAIQGDISKCFDNIPHELIINQVNKKIVDNRFIELIRKFLETGYKDPKSGKINPTVLGIPQGGILSPILCNIILHLFDSYMDKLARKYSKGIRRAHNKEYQRLEYRRRKAKTMLERKKLLQQMRMIGNVDRFDPNFKRLKYIRYADDFVILTIGTKDEATMIKNNCKEFLKANCGVELNTDKTIISNLQDNKFHFLGAEIVKLKRNHTFIRSNKATKSYVATNRPLVKAPIQKLLEKLKTSGFIQQNHNKQYLPQHIGALLNLSHYDIITYYNSRIQGILNFYSFAANLNKLGRIIWYLHASCALTLARKYKLGTMKKTYEKFGKYLECPETQKQLFKPDNLRVKHDYKKNYSLPNPMSLLDITWAGKLTETNFGKTCTICGSTTQIEMHHLRSVKDVRAKIRTGDVTFAQWEGATRRKQIPLCNYHHELYHKGLLNHADLKEIIRFTG